MNNDEKKAEYSTNQQKLLAIALKFIAIKGFANNGVCDPRCGIEPVIAQHRELKVYWQEMTQSAREEFERRYGSQKLSQFESLISPWDRLEDNDSLSDDAILKVVRRVLSSAKRRKKNIPIIFAGCKLNLRMMEYIERNFAEHVAGCSE